MSLASNLCIGTVCTKYLYNLLILNYGILSIVFCFYDILSIIITINNINDYISIHCYKLLPYAKPKTEDYPRLVTYIVPYLSVTTSYVVRTLGVYSEAPIVSDFMRRWQWNLASGFCMLSHSPYIRYKEATDVGLQDILHAIVMRISSVKTVLWLAVNLHHLFSNGAAFNTQSRSFLTSYAIHAHNRRWIACDSECEIA